MTHQLTDNETEVDVELYRDLRGTQRERKLRAKQAAKYYGYRGVKPSWVDQLYYNFPTHLRGPKPFWCAARDPMISYPEDAEVVRWTKQDMWEDRESDIWPLDVRHSVGRKIREPDCYGWHPRLRMGGMRMKSRILDFASEYAYLLGSGVDDDYEPPMQWINDESDDGSYDSDELDDPPIRNTLFLRELLPDKPGVVGSSGLDTERGPMLQDEENQQGAEDDGFVLVSEEDFDAVSVPSSNYEYELI